MFRVAEPGQVVFVAAVFALVLAVVFRRRRARTDGDLTVMSFMYAEGYEQGRLGGMAEAFDVIAEHRQTQPY